MGKDIFGIDLGNDERHVLLQTVKTGVVDNDRAGFYRERCPPGGDVVLGRSEDLVNIVKTVFRQLPDHILLLKG